MLLFEMPAGIEWLFIGGLGLLIIPAIFYLLTLQSTLNVIAVENRKIRPGEVWLLLIPFFNLVWHFIVVGRLSDSIKAEAEERNISSYAEQRPAYSIGLAMCILACCVIVPKVGGLAYIAGLVCWIVYWVKINNYKNLLLRGQIATKF